MNLLAPLPLGPRTAPNRLMFGPHVTNLGAGRALSERHVAYYARRAAGGAGVIVTEIASVHESDWPYERAPLASSCASGWAPIVSACRPYGALVLGGVGHAGGQGTSAYSQAPMWAPSGVPEVNTREMPKVMEDEDVAAVIAGFGRAAGVAASAGLDGVEVNAGQYSLVRQFCSGLTNQRSDVYGADRTLFAREVLAAVRSGLGPSLVLGLRVCADELAPWAGITPEAAVPLVAELAAYADYVVVERGSIYSAAATRPDLHTSPGFNLAVTREIRAALTAAAPAPSAPSGAFAPGEAFAPGGAPAPAEPPRASAPAGASASPASPAPSAPPAHPVRSAHPGASAPPDASTAPAPPAPGAPGRAPGAEAGRGSVPVFAQGSIVDSSMAEDAIADGTADGVEMTRAQIADAELGRKLAAGRVADVRPCVLCNQTCQVRDNRNPIVTCIGDPRSGHETEDADPEAGPARDGLDVLVVGGGPAGLEAARVAAAHGHRVRLVESDTRLGGRIRVAATAPALSRLADLADWLESQCRALGVKLEPGHTLTRDETAAHDGPVLVCTGARDRPAEYEIASDAHAVSADRFLAEMNENALPYGSPPPSQGGDPTSIFAGSQGSAADVNGVLGKASGRSVDIAIWDPVGGPVGVAIAEMLAARDDVGTVSLIFPDQIPGQNLALSGDLAPANTRLQSAGVRLERRATLRRVTADGAEIEDHFGAGSRTVPAGLVIDAGHRLPDETLPGIRTGDAVAPRTIHEAILEGRRAALALEEGA